MTAPGELGETGPGEHGELGEHAAAMRDLVPGQPEQVAPEVPSVGEFYRELAESDEVRNPTLRHLLSRAAEANGHQGRIWLDEDEAPRPGSYNIAQHSEDMARRTIGQAFEDASKWLDVFERGVRTRDVLRGTRTLLDLHGGDHFDGDMLEQFARVVGMDLDSPVQAIPQSGETAQPDRFAERFYGTHIDGVQVRASSHRRDGESIWVDQVGGTLRGDNYTKYSLVPASQAAERAA